MEYLILKNLYHRDQKQYQQLLANRLNAQDSLYRIPVNISGNPAFIVISQEIMSLITQIYYRNNKLTRLFNALPDVIFGQYFEQLIVDEIQASNEMEGVRSTKKELLATLNNPNPHRKRKFQGLVNYYAQILKPREKPIPLATSQDIRDLYDVILAPEIAPEDQPDGDIFRKNEVHILSAATGRDIHQGLLPESRIIQTIDQCLNFLNDENIPHIIRITAFHYLLGYIHPFYDGNGRLSRFITSYLLIDPLNFLVAMKISTSIFSHLNSYYKAFETCNHPLNKGDITPFIIFFLELIYETIENLIADLTQKQNKLEYYENLLEQERFASLNHDAHNILFQLIQITVFTDTAITRAELAQISKYSHYKLNKYLSQLESLGYITKTQNKSYRYLANIELLDNQEA